MHEDIGPVDAQIPQATYLAMMPDGSVVQESLMLDNSGPLEDQIQREVSMNPQLYDNTVFELPNGLLHMLDGQGTLMDGNMLDAMENPSIMGMLGQPTNLPVQNVMPQEELPADFGPILDEMAAAPVDMSLGPEDFGSFTNEFARPENMPFDPEGSGYDYGMAEMYGMTPDASGHYFSRVPQTGLLLKGAGHPTFPKTLAAEAAMGNTVTQGPDGRYYSN